MPGRFVTNNSIMHSVADFKASCLLPPKQTAAPGCPGAAPLYQPYPIVPTPISSAQREVCSTRLLMIDSKKIEVIEGI